MWSTVYPDMTAIFLGAIHENTAVIQKAGANALGVIVNLDLPNLETRLAQSFTARFGPQLGREVTAEAMAWAWEHRDELDGMANPAGYLFRVGQSKSRRLIRWRREQIRFPAEDGDHSDQSHRDADEATPSWTEPGLAPALMNLKANERTPVVLVHCFQWSYQEVADLLDVPLHTVRNRIHRAMAQLRTDLGVDA